MNRLGTTHGARPARLGLVAGITVATVAVALTGCTGGGAPSDGSFVSALGADLGTLDPHLGTSSGGFSAAKYAYDPLLHIDGEGALSTGIAESWEVDGTTVTFTLREGVTCSDGSTFTASTAKANFDFIGDPENASPLLGVFYPAGATVEADDDARTLTLELAGPAPFVLEGLASVVLVCDAAIEDRSLLESGTVGTGPFVLTEALPNDRYSYEVRDGYAWGPDGASTDEAGFPQTVELRVIDNETTAANLLVSGDLNAASIFGPDAARLADLAQGGSRAITGEAWFNHAEGRATAETEVRIALTQALDLDELANVITSGTGERATQFAVAAPAACVGGDFSSALPEAGAEAAAETLDAAGWTLGADGLRSRDGVPLSIVFIHDSVLGSGGSAAAELAIAAWAELGITVDASTMPTDELSGVIFGGGAWDVVWEPLNVNTPDQLLGFLAGATPAEGGVNFAAIANAEYAAATEEALALSGTDSCEAFFEGERALIESMDVLPFANSLLSVYGSGATFEISDSIIPTSIRLVG